MSVGIDVQGVPEVQAALDELAGPKLRRKLTKATAAGAKALKPYVKAEAAKVSKRLARSTSAGQAKRDRPAGIVKFRPKVAWFRHFIVGGTRAHGPRKAPYLHFRGRRGWVVTKRVAGVKANPIIARVVAAHGDEALRAVERELEKETS